jgi:electron transfer flavoprotein alpha subunit
MAGAVVFVEHAAGEAQKASLGVLSHAAALFGEVSACLCGSDVGGIASVLGAHGATRVYVADAPELAEPLPQPRVDVLARLLADHEIDTVVFGASVLASDVAAGLAARTGGGLNWDLTDLVLDGDRLVGKRPALQDSVVVDCGWEGTPRIALVRSGTFEPAEADGGSPELVPLPVELEDFSARAVMVDRELALGEGPAIEEADVIVAGGRGLGAPDQFAVVEALAEALGGAVAATRAVVDAGWYPYSTQVGQTGKTVAPRLYVACGISGAIQHKVGMQGSGAIVAINKDRNAPIFDYCDLGVVGDLFDIVPKLTELVRERAA